jgi:predicted nuclease of predicted toxin-antitoxin system
MDLVADVHVKRAYLTALRAEAHSVERVVDVDTLGPTATDGEILGYARSQEAVILTNDAKDFTQFDDHAGIIIVPQTELTAGEVAAAVARIERLVPDYSTMVLYATDWV